MGIKRDVKLKLVITFIVLIASIYFALTKPIKLGLDLQGGMSIVLDVDVDYVIQTQYKQLAEDIENKLKKEKIDVLEVKFDKTSNNVVVSLLDDTQLDKAFRIIEKEFPYAVAVKEGDRISVSFIQRELDRIKKLTVQQAVETLRNRIDEFGTLNANIAKLGTRRVIVELPGVVDPKRAKSIIGKTAQLEILEVVDYAYSEKELKSKYPTLPKGTKILEGNEREIKGRKIKEWFLVKTTPIITGSDLKDARTTLDQSGNPAVNFELTSKGAEKFGEATGKLIGKRMAIVLDNKVISAPVVRSRITSSGQITGDFTPEEAADLAIVLRAGALPAPVHILEERLIGPTLGKDSIEKTINAGIVALILVGLFMIWRYAISGFVSIIALLFNGLLLWAVLVALGITLTLPGIAGIILNIGMAVDANVIIFERVKEEFKKGKTLRVALEEGFRRAWDAILDAQITTLIAAFVLFQFGTGPLKGFAATLSIGTITSIFTAVFITKLFLDLIFADKKSMKYAF